MCLRDSRAVIEGWTHPEIEQETVPISQMLWAGSFNPFFIVLLEENLER